MNPDKFIEWLLTAKRGDSLIYYTGNLSQDRQRSFQLAFLATYVLSKSEALLPREHQHELEPRKGTGQVALFQRRLAYKFEYIAVKL